MAQLSWVQLTTKLTEIEKSSSEAKRPIQFTGQLEKSINGMYHAQLAMKSPTNMRFKAIKTMLGCDCHCAVARHMDKVIAYVHKESTRVTKIGEHEIHPFMNNALIGSYASKKGNQGKRTDITACSDMIEDLVKQNKSDQQIQAELTKFPDVLVKYHSGLNHLIASLRIKHRVAPEVLDLPVMGYKWQKDLLSLLLEKPDKRTVYWIVGKEGDEGKTALAKYLAAKRDWIMCGGDQKSMAFKLANVAVRTGNPEELAKLPPRGATFDCTRVMEYSEFKAIAKTAEDLKNGYVHSDKYVPRTGEFNDMHAVVFVNELPLGVSEPTPEGKWLLSRDRSVVWNVSKDGFGPLERKRKRAITIATEVEKWESEED